jgi:hypothetical protein
MVQPTVATIASARGAASLSHHAKKGKHNFRDASRADLALETDFDH